jgi:hypothetical protein
MITAVDQDAPGTRCAAVAMMAVRELLSAIANTIVFSRAGSAFSLFHRPGGYRVARYLSQLDSAGRHEPTEALAERVTWLKEKLTRVKKAMDLSN